MAFCLMKNAHVQIKWFKKSNNISHNNHNNVLRQSNGNNMLHIYWTEIIMEIILWNDSSDHLRNWNTSNEREMPIQALLNQRILKSSQNIIFKATIRISVNISKKQFFVCFEDSDMWSSRSKNHWRIKIDL